MFPLMAGQRRGFSKIRDRYIDPQIVGFPYHEGTPSFGAPEKGIIMRGSRHIELKKLRMFSLQEQPYLEVHGFFGNPINAVLIAVHVTILGLQGLISGFSVQLLLVRKYHEPPSRV